MKDAAGSKRDLEAASDVARWLESVAVEERSGLRWPDRPEVSRAGRPSLGWGGLGPIVFFADAYRTVGERRWLERGDSGGRQLCSLMDDLDPEIPPGLFTGLGGWAVVFHELERIGLDYADQKARVFGLLRDCSQPDGGGVQWAEATEVLWGTSGIGFLLLAIGVDVLGDDALDLASRAGDWILSQAHDAGGGLRWDMGPGPARRSPTSAGVWFPNFAHGTAGIGAFLARLGAAVNDDRYADAARRAAAWILTTCRTADGTCAAHHHDPAGRAGYNVLVFFFYDWDNSVIYTMGWCHGPPGLGWFFRELELATGEADWAEWVTRTAKAVRTSGIPERR